MAINFGGCFRFRMLTALAIGFTFWVISSRESHAEINGDPAILKLVAEIYQANKEKISTWSGRARVTDRQELEGRELWKIESNVVFFVRNDTGQLRWKWTITSIKGEVKSPNPTVVSNGLVTEDRFISVQRSRDPVKGPPRIFIQPKDKMVRGVLSYEFSPMQSFYSDEDVAEKFLTFFNKAKLFTNEWTVSRPGDGDIVTLRFQQDKPADKRRFNEWVVDLGKGATLSRYSAGTGDVPETEYDWTYNLVDGVWLPCTLKYRNTTLARPEDKEKKIPATEESARLRTIQWEESKVNEPIADGEFSIEKLEIKNGEMIIDTLTKSNFRYNE